MPEEIFVTGDDKLWCELSIEGPLGASLIVHRVNIEPSTPGRWVLGHLAALFICGGGKVNSRTIHISPMIKGVKVEGESNDN